MPDFAVLFPAGGLSTRFTTAQPGGSGSKLVQVLAGKTVLQHSLEAFSRRSDVRIMIVAAAASVRAQIPALPNLKICEGGRCRAESVLNALWQVPADIEWVAVHDAARPLISQELIDRTLAAALEHGAAAPAMPVVQTIRRTSGPLPAASDGVVPRDKLFAMQTPQIMRREALLAAFKACSVPYDQITDDIQLLELAGHSVWLTPGEERNLKITTPADMVVASAMLTR